MPQVMVLPPSLTSTTTKVSGASTTSSHATRSAPISKFDSAAQSSTPTHAPSPRLLSPPTRTSSTTQPTTLASASATTATPETGPLAHQLTLPGHAKTTSRLASRCSPQTPTPTLMLSVPLCRAESSQFPTSTTSSGLTTSTS